jgi:hypothetical protein
VYYGNVEFDQPDVSYYYVQTGTYTVTYKYTIGSDSASASVRFQVRGPIGPNVTFATDTVRLEPPNCTSDCTVMSFGDYSHTQGAPYGIVMTAEAVAPEGFPGKFVWVQTIYDQINYVIYKRNFQCPLFEGLDKSFPYSNVRTSDSRIKDNVLQDIPHVTLGNRTQLSRSFSAFDVLMWQASPGGKFDVQTSFPVSIGYVSWGFYGSANLARDPNTQQKVWTLKTHSVQPPVFTAELYLPTWNSVVESPNENFPSLCIKEQP